MAQPEGKMTSNLVADVFVAGGGLAGVSAALAAARNGARAVLCQDRSVLGGNASSEIRMHVVGADALGQRGIEFETEAREGGIIEEIRLENAVRNPQNSPSMFDLILYEKCRAEENLTLLLNTCLVGASVSDGLIAEVTARRESTEETLRIRAAVYIDCTGDGRLGFEAGAEFTAGRESLAEFNEPDGLPERDNKRLGSSLLFTARDMGRPAPFEPPPWAHRYTEEDLQGRPHGQWAYGYWWIEYGGEIDTIKDNEEIRDELLAILLGVWDHIKNSGNHPESENWALDWIGFLPGKRESRRFLGHHVLTQNDLLEPPRFDDVIAHGGWSMDTHPPEGITAKDKAPAHQPLMPHLYGIPLAACRSRNVRNLLFAGRNISATHLAFSSTRVMATCSVMGQGVGTVAALLAESGRVEYTPALVRAAQHRLLRQDVFLPGVPPLIEEEDLVRRGRVTASSHLPEGPPGAILDGETRAVHGRRGVPDGWSAAGAHRWISEPGDKEPWIEVRWDDPVAISRIELVFDTGMHRQLTFTLAQFLQKQIIWSPQPETIRSFALLADFGKGLEPIHHCDENSQRLLVLDLSLRDVRALRIAVRRTHGVPEARLFALRCYT